MTSRAKGSVIWPEFVTAQARFVTGFWPRQWLLLGHGFIWGIRGHRMSECWPVHEDENPVVIARQCERRWVR
jgi:hypothetical protein